MKSIDQIFFFNVFKFILFKQKLSQYKRYFKLYPLSLSERYNFSKLYYNYVFLVNKKYHNTCFVDHL